MKVIWLVILISGVLRARVIHRGHHAKPSTGHASRGLKIKDQIFETSGSIKIGMGDDFDRNGKKLSSGSSGSGPKMPAKIEMAYPEISDPNDDQAAYASFPNYVMAPASKQKPIVIIPEIIYPNIKKRVFVHHYDASRMYRDMMMSPTYLAHLAMKNPEYERFYTKPLKEKFKDYPHFKKYKPSRPFKMTSLKP
jgi:hypothetical protein